MQQGAVALQEVVTQSALPACAFTAAANSLKDACYAAATHSCAVACWTWQVLHRHVATHYIVNRWRAWSPGAPSLATYTLSSLNLLRNCRAASVLIHSLTHSSLRCVLQAAPSTATTSCCPQAHSQKMTEMRIGPRCVVNPLHTCTVRQQLLASQKGTTDAHTGSAVATAVLCAAHVLKVARRTS